MMRATTILAISLLLPGCPPPERCDDGLDNDYDGLVDEECLAAAGWDTAEGCVDPPGWYADEDGDGYGSDELMVWSCDTPSGFVDVAGDCDDDDPAVYPQAEEIPGDGIDQDCDGVTE